MAAVEPTFNDLVGEACKHPRTYRCDLTDWYWCQRCGAIKPKYSSTWRQSLLKKIGEEEFLLRARHL